MYLIISLNIIPNMGTSAHGPDRSWPGSDLQRIIDSTPALIHTARPDGYHDFFNETWLNYVGCTLEDLPSVHSEDGEGMVSAWRTSLASGEPFQYEARVRRADGQYRWMLHQKVAVRDEQENIVKWYGVVTDIEDRKREEYEVRKQESELRQIVDLVPQINAVFGPGGERLYANRIGLDYAGLSLEEWRQAPGNFFSSPWFIHPDDRERAARTYSDNARSGGSAFELELRLPKRDGTYRWFLARFNPLCDEQGQITRWYVAYTDIEDRKRAEDKIREQEAELRQMPDLAPQQVRVYGPSGERLYANRIALDYYGVSFEEWRQTPGHSFRSSLFVHPDDQEHAARDFDANSSSGSAYELELRVRGADGNYRWFLVRHNPLETRRQALPLAEGGSGGKRNNRSSFARMPRTGIRTFRRSRQARDRTIYTGIKDSITKDQQESLQGLARELYIA
jgi:PAS domain S-box-containing protein